MRKARRQLALGKSLVPQPLPTPRMVPMGRGPKEEAKVFRSAAPVGVQSSAGMSPHHGHVHHHYQHEHRTLADIDRMVDGFGLPAAVREKAKEVYRLLAAAESRAHGVSVEQVHFHEVGAGPRTGPP